MDAKKIYIYSFSRNMLFDFPAYLVDYNDNYKSGWKREEVLGKMDPIATFKNTVRTINLSFEIPAENWLKSNEYFNNIQYLIEGLYPVYDEGVQGRAILASPPMFRVRFSNLIRNSSYFIEDDSSDPTLKTGLLCYIENFDFKPKVDSGFFINKEELYPKLISVNLVLNIIHEFPLGNKMNGQVPITRHAFENFPYKRNIKKPVPLPVPPADKEPAPRPPGAPVDTADTGIDFGGGGTGTVVDGGQGINGGGTGRRGGDIPGKPKVQKVLTDRVPNVPSPYPPKDNGGWQEWGSGAPLLTQEQIREQNTPKTFSSRGNRPVQERQLRHSREAPTKK